MNGGISLVFCIIVVISGVTAYRSRGSYREYGRNYAGYPGSYVNGICNCPPGPPGIRGVVGPRGAPGERGDKGNSGAMGDLGLPGATGVDGSNGAPGVQGPRGPLGPRGPRGFIGPIGVVGAIGPIGAVGPIGPPGTAAVRRSLDDDSDDGNLDETDAAEQDFETEYDEEEVNDLT